ncbi:MobC family plasmid mobilization relaxosome protein [Lutibacter sp. A80]|uniref:plasmid mobilization protein n=1 Tax=Lutibacter sp. A80 TaxID=2918453 RepID=UPI001F061C41|nr:plasmid mobilization relaxosome protein MobC [Lutibacter sp. A80]UMB59983.1 MobC family plasmid mobilization relaxosome protein [Lutibacter sp. A80]
MKHNISKINKRVVSYLSFEDKELLINQCNLLEIKTSFFIRNSILEKLGKPIFTPKIQNIETKNYISQLLRTGNNLNQIARNLNSGKAKFMIADQQTVLNEIKNINNHILEIKSKL